MIERHSGQIVFVWPSVRRELRTMAELVPFMEARLGWKLSSTVFGTDAMGANEVDNGGFGIVGRKITAELAREIYEQGTAVGRTVVRLDGDPASIKFSNRGLPRNIPFTRLPDQLFGNEDDWTELEGGRWKYADHIRLGASRTVVRLLRLLGREPGAHKKIILSLQDNQPTSGSMTKGRSPAPA